ncbi:MAG TPA: UDP-N-acetylmuramoyl-L-alanine--D-glutamate ligase [Gaiellaceae bacterium]|nr:UDP-N-acetylmuramoyl-L-alanine--D-glutamate ligase [Gaiellaceae bacterium]
MSEDWLPRRALVVGLGRTGAAALTALRTRGIDADGVDRSLGNEDPAALEGVEVLVKGPGVPPSNEVVRAAHERGLPVWSELELGYRLLPDGVRISGVTGTKGKTTVVRMLGAMLAAGGRDVTLGGNEHAPVSEVAETIEPGSELVLELSSFALNDVDAFACDVAVLLNLEPDHLNWHGSFEAYRDAKLRVFEHAGTKVAPRGFGIDDAVEFSGDDPLPAEPRMPGAHNRENAAAAAAAARASGVGDEAIAEALRTFEGVPHRLELVRELHGVRYVNDSKATNTAAARRGVAAYTEPLHLILGGSLKGEDFGPLARDLPANVRSVHLIGAAADELAQALDAAGRAYTRDGDLPTALRHAAGDARAGDVVLLSPACASFDQFSSFEERGDTFRTLVEGLA